MSISSKHDDIDTDQTHILRKAIDEIKSDTNTDPELLDILEKHIITLNPDVKPVEQTVEKIEKLAQERAEA